MRVFLFYDAIKIEGPKKKILEFNGTHNFMNEKDLKVFEGLCTVLEDKNKYHTTKINDYQSQLLDKLIGTQDRLPVEICFPMLDLYRIFLCHPDVACHFKKFEEGANHVTAICYPLRDKNAGDPAKMLALRCLVNMFKEMTAIFVVKEKYEKVIEAVTPHLSNPKTNIREAAITVLLNLSIAFL